MPAKITKWDKAKIGHVLIVLAADDTASRIEIGYDLSDQAEPTMSRHQTMSLQPPGPRFAAAAALVATLIADVKAQEGL